MAKLSKAPVWTLNIITHTETISSSKKSAPARIGTHNLARKVSTEVWQEGHQPKFLLLTTADGASPRRVALAIQSLTKTLEKYKMIVLVCEREESERDGERERRRREVWRGRLVVLNLCCSCLEQKSNNKRI